jgi:hypothetical protein
VFAGFIKYARILNVWLWVAIGASERQAAYEHSRRTLAFSFRQAAWLKSPALAVKKIAAPLAK